MVMSMICCCIMLHLSIRFEGTKSVKKRKRKASLAALESGTRLGNTFNSRTPCTCAVTHLKSSTAAGCVTSEIGSILEERLLPFVANCQSPNLGARASAQMVRYVQVRLRSEMSRQCRANSLSMRQLCHSQGLQHIRMARRNFMTRRNRR